MAQQIFKQAGRRREEDDPFADDQGWSPQHKSGQSSTVSSNASGTLGDIDKTLAEQEAAGVPQTGGGAHSSSAEGAQKLSDSEQEPPDRSGFSAADDINERLGKGYTGKDSKKSAVFSKLYSSDSKFKKKIAIAGAAAGGSVIASVLVFLALLPLKIEHVVQNLEGHYGASPQAALDNETANLLDKYMVTKVFPNLGKGDCHSTIDLSCVASPSPGSSPINKLFTAWKQARLENKLATKYNLAFGKKNGRYYLNTNASTIDLGDGKTIFGDAGTKEVTKRQIGLAIKTATKDATFYDKMWFRFKVWPYAAAKFGIVRCVTFPGCEKIQNKLDTLAEKKLAAKGYLIQKVIGPINQGWATALKCVLGGGSVCDTTPTDDETVDASGDQVKLSQFQENLQSELAELAASEEPEALSKVLSDAEDISEKGFVAVAFEKVATSLGFKVGVGESVAKAIPVIGWINIVAGLVSSLNNIGPKLQAIDYAINSAGAVKEYVAYRNVADEEKSGNIDVTEAGSFTDTLSDDTQLDGTGSDMTASPLYANIMNGSGGTTNTASIFSDIFGGIASADAATPREDSSDPGVYTCDNGAPPVSGKEVCTEEVLNGGSNVANAVTNIEQSVPNWNAMVIAANNWNATLGKIFQVLGTAVGDITSWVLKGLGLDSVLSFITKIVTPLLTAVTDHMLTTPFSANMSGGRNFDMIAAGTDVSENQSCQVQLGCAKLTNTQAAQIQNEQIAEQKAEFDSMPMFARIFDTDSSYSLVSRLAMDMPTSMLTATNDGLSSVLINPFSRLADAFSGLFSFSDTAFAAEAAQADPFGVTQNGYTSVPSDPEAYWDQNCVNGPMATYNASTEEIDVTNWLNNDQAENTATGEAEATSTDPCLLIMSAVQGAGGIFDNSLLPSGSGAGS